MAGLLPPSMPRSVGHGNMCERRRAASERQVAFGWVCVIWSIEVPVSGLDRRGATERCSEESNTTCPRGARDFPMIHVRAAPAAGEGGVDRAPARGEPPGSGRSVAQLAVVV